MTLREQDPPVVHVRWQIPRNTFGDLSGYRLSYGIKGERNVEERPLSSDLYNFEARFLGELGMV